MVGGSPGVSRWPARGQRVVGGCSWVDHRLVGAARLVRLQVQLLSFGGLFGTWAMGWVVSGTLLGPEGSGVSPVFQFGPHLLVVPAVPVVGVVGAGVWWGSARMLRTTQWTRASL